MQSSFIMLTVLPKVKFSNISGFEHLSNTLSLNIGWRPSINDIWKTTCCKGVWVHDMSHLTSTNKSRHTSKITHDLTYYCCWFKRICTHAMRPSVMVGSSRPFGKSPFQGVSTSSFPFSYVTYVVRAIHIQLFTCRQLRTQLHVLPTAIQQSNSNIVMIAY